MTYAIPTSTGKSYQSNQTQNPTANTNKRKPESQSPLDGIQPLTQQKTAKIQATAVSLDPRLPSVDGNKRVNPSTLLSRKLVSVPEHLRKLGEDDKTTISQTALSKRRLVPVPEHLRKPGEDDNTMICRAALSKRRLVPQRVNPSTLLSRKLVSVPEDLRKEGEDGNTMIPRATLDSRKVRRADVGLFALNNQSAVEPLPFNARIEYSNELIAELESWLPE